MGWMWAGNSPIRDTAPAESSGTGIGPPDPSSPSRAGVHAVGREPVPASVNNSPSHRCDRRRGSHQAPVSYHRYGRSRLASPAARRARPPRRWRFASRVPSASLHTSTRSRHNHPLRDSGAADHPGHSVPHQSQVRSRRSVEPITSSLRFPIGFHLFEHDPTRCEQPRPEWAMVLPPSLMESAANRLAGGTARLLSPISGGGRRRTKGRPARPLPLFRTVLFGPLAHPFLLAPEVGDELSDVLAHSSSSAPGAYDSAVRLTWPGPAPIGRAGPAGYARTGRGTIRPSRTGR